MSHIIAIFFYFSKIVGKKLTSRRILLENTKMVATCTISALENSRRGGNAVKHFPQLQHWLQCGRSYVFKFLISLVLFSDKTESLNFSLFFDTRFICLIDNMFDSNIPDLKIFSLLMTQTY